MEINGYHIMFAIFSLIIVAGSVLTVTSRRILRAATYLLCVLVATSGLYFLLHFQFLAAVQLTLYAGGIVVLIIFSILLTSHINQKFEKIRFSKAAFSFLAAAAGFVLVAVTLLQHGFNADGFIVREVSMNTIGKSLLSYTVNGYVLPFELISVLLLAAMVASVVIAKKQSKNNS